MIKVLIADDQPLVRAGVRLILEPQPDIEIVGEAADGLEAVAQASRLGPDLVLMDIRMPLLDGLEATRQICADKSLPTKVLILTTFDIDDYVFRALRAGASGFLLKDALPEQIAAAVRLVASGDALLAPPSTRRLIERFAGPARPRTPSAVDSLSERESEVLTLIARGLSNQELGEELHLSEGTVKSHVSHILTKLGVRDRIHAVIAAYESGHT